VNDEWQDEEGYCQVGGHYMPADYLSGYPRLVGAAEPTFQVCDYCEPTVAHFFVAEALSAGLGREEILDRIERRYTREGMEDTGEELRRELDGRA